MNCTICHQPIQEHPEEAKTINSKPVCDDCYYEKLGELVEESPIVSGRCGHGAVAGD